MSTGTAPMTDLIPIVMPKWGLSMEEGTVAVWHFAEGDTVPPGAELVDIETSKLLNTLEAKQGGTLFRIVCKEGAQGPCGSLIAVMGQGDAPSAEALDAFVAQFVVTSDETAAAGERGAAVADRIAVDGLALNYVAMGDGDETVLFLHGFGGDSGNWLLVQSEVAARCRTIALDLPGHGGSDKALPGAGDLAALAAHVGRFLDEIGIEKVHLVGHSFGGAVANRIAAGSDGRVLSLTLVAPLLGGLDLDRSFLHEFVAARRSRDLREVLSRLVADPGNIGRAMVEDVLRYKRVDGVAAVLAQLIALAEQEALSGTPEPGAPALAIWGESDRIIPLPAAGSLGPRTRLEVIRAAGHLPHLEQPGQVARIILDALEA